MFIRSAYNYDVNQASRESGLCCDEVSMAVQSHKEECDINTIVKRFGVGYKMPEGLRVPQYGDFTGIASYHDACNAIAQAGESFDALPAMVRDRFQNDPGKFVEFVTNKDTPRSELEQLGLVPKAPPAPVVTLPVAAAVSEAVAAPVAPPASS